MTDLEEPRHPTGRELSEFERRLLRLALMGHEAQQLLCSVTKTEERKQDTQLLFSLQHYSLIIVCRFLEIWPQFQSLGKDNDQIKTICRAASHYVDRINIWPGLKDFRDWILAHKYQIGKDPAFIPPWLVLHTGRVPVNTPEWFVLLDCVIQAVACVLAYYGDIYRSLAPVLDPGQEPVYVRGVHDGAEGQAERIRLATEGNKQLTALGVDLADPVFQQFRCSPKKNAG